MERGELYLDSRVRVWRGVSGLVGWCRWVWQAGTDWQGERTGGWSAPGNI